MGTLNNRGGEVLEDLNQICIACNSEGISPIDFNKSLNTFDYWCKFCQKYISISQVVYNKHGRQLPFEVSRFQIDLREDIKNSVSESYIIDCDTLNFFRGKKFEERISNPIEAWLNGKLPGSIKKYKFLSLEQVEAIRKEQQRVLNEKVEQRLEGFLKRFNANSQKSIEPRKQLIIEVEEIGQLLDDKQSSGENERIEFGSFTFNKNLISKVRKHYRDSVLGKDYFDYVISPKQEKLAGRGWDTENALIFAIALKRYLDILSQRLFETQERETPDNDEQAEIRSRIDELLYKLEKLELGQEIVFDEIESLKIPLKKLSKRDFKQLVIGKVWEMIYQEVISSKMAREIVEGLFGESFAKFLPNS